MLYMFFSVWLRTGSNLEDINRFQIKSDQMIFEEKFKKNVYLSHYFNNLCFGLPNKYIRSGFLINKLEQ